MSEDQRKNLRVNFKASLRLRPLDGSHAGLYLEQTKDLSIKGLYCLSDIKFPVNTPCDMELLLSSGELNLCLKMKGTIVRVDSQGMGIRFDEMDLETFSHLKNILSYNSGDSDRILREISP
jgi:hypothetical protein